MLYAFNRSRRKRRNSRRRGRNAWFGSRRKHAAAARRGWAGRRRGRRSRRRGCNPVAFNGRRRRRRSRNGSAILPGGMTRGLTAGFNTGILKSSAVIVGGSLLNNFLTAQLSNLIPISFFKSGIGSYVTGLISAGLLYKGAKMVLPGYAGDLFKGGVLDVVSRVANRYVVPMLPGPKLVSGYISGMGDYLTVGDARRARPLMGLGDYLTVGDAARARPLSGLGYDDELDGMHDYDGNVAIAEELEG